MVRHHEITSVIGSCRETPDIQENIASLEWNIGDDMMQEIEAVPGCSEGCDKPETER